MADDDNSKAAQIKRWSESIDSRSVLNLSLNGVKRRLKMVNSIQEENVEQLTEEEKCEDYSKENSQEEKSDVFTDFNAIVMKNRDTIVELNKEIKECQALQETIIDQQEEIIDYIAEIIINIRIVKTKKSEDQPKINNSVIIELDKEMIKCVALQETIIDQQEKITDHIIKTFSNRTAKTEKSEDQPKENNKIIEQEKMADNNSKKTTQKENWNDFVNSQAIKMANEYTIDEVNTQLTMINSMQEEINKQLTKEKKCDNLHEKNNITTNKRKKEDNSQEEDTTIEVKRENKKRKLSDEEEIPKASCPSCESWETIAFLYSYRKKEWIYACRKRFKSCGYINYCGNMWIESDKTISKECSCGGYKDLDLEYRLPGYRCAGCGDFNLIK